MQRHVSAIFGLSCLFFCTISFGRVSPPTPQFVNGSDVDSNRNMGRGFSNRLPVPDEDRGNLKTKTLRALNRDVTVQEFLGGKINLIRVVSFQDKRLKDFGAAKEALQKLLSSVILSPKIKSSNPYLYEPWDDGTRPPIVSALIFYDGGFIGRIETDGNKIFFQDNDGLYWWDYRRD